MEQKKTYIEYRCDECDKIIPYGSEIAVKTNYNNWNDEWGAKYLFCSESCFIKYAKRNAKLEKVTWKYEPEYEYIASPENGFLVEFISKHEGQPYFGNSKYIIFDECRIEFDFDYRRSIGLNDDLEPIDTTSDCETSTMHWINNAFDYKKTVERFGAFEVLHCTNYEEYRNYLRNMRNDFPIDLLNFCIEYLKNGENKLIERMEIFRGMEKLVVLKCADKYALIRFT